MAQPLAIVRASAGSGKTFTLALEYCRAVVERPQAYREILAVTFTNKATAEMKRRIVEELAALAEGKKSAFASRIVQQTALAPSVVAVRAREALRLILTDFSAFSVMTIDKFFQKIVRSFFRELGLDFTYKVEIQSNQSILTAIDRLIEHSGEDHLLGQLLERLIGERLDRGVRWNVEDELYKISPEIFNSDFSPSPYSAEELIAAFSNLKKEYDRSGDLLRQACAATCQLIENVGLDPSDFKYGSTSFAHYLFRIARGEDIVSYGKRFAALPDNPESAYNEKSNNVAAIKSILPDIVRSVASIITFYDQNACARSTFEALEGNFSRYLLLSRLKKSFDEVLAQQGKMAISSSTDFIDQIAQQASVPFIFEKLGSRYSTIFIDEFQDTSSAQWRGFLPLLHEIVATEIDARRVMLIGDVKQAIYRWRGGDWDILGYKAADEFQGMIEALEPLNTSYRSEAEIVDFNNSLISSVLRVAQNNVAEFLSSGERGELYDTLITALPRSYSDSVQNIAPTKATPRRGYVSLDRYESTDQALEQMIATIDDALARGYKMQDIAILVRRRDEGKQVAKALIDRSLPIVSDEVLTISASSVVAFVVNVFRYATSGDKITLGAINHYLGRDFTNVPTGEDEQFFMLLTHRSPIEALEATIAYFSLQALEPAYLQTLYEQIYKFTLEASADISAFLLYWDEHHREVTLPLSGAQSAITVLTIHKAKGLEFPIVIIPFASWSVTPSSKTRLWVSSDIEPYSTFNPFPVNYKKELNDSVFRSDYLREGVYSMVDNLNMLYVALTRAKVELYVFLPTNPTKNSIGRLIDTAIGLMDFEGSVGVKEQAAESRELQQTLFIDRLDSYAIRSVLDLSDASCSEADDLASVL
ncbi:MAG: UvrD-helicase domain-containing protein [Mucinivorans sp.]